MNGTGEPVVAGRPQENGQLELRAEGRVWHATPDRPWRIGRALDVDVRTQNPRVSRHHATLTATPDGWVLVNHSPAGMIVDGQPLKQLTVKGPVTVWLGPVSDGVMIQLTPSALPNASVREPSAVHNIDRPAVRIGRAPDNDVVMADLLVSRHHAELRRSGDRWVLVDLGSANGTYVNGARITRAALGPTDIVVIGHQRLHLAGDRLEEYIDTGDVSFEATGLTVATGKGRVLLDNVGFALPQRSFLAVVGPTGAGKSTLLGALTGFRPARTGQVCYAGRDLYANYAELRHRIGFVPQDDILHTQLTVWRALNYAAQLRFPDDVSRTERLHRIDEVLTELGLRAQANQRISSLSGGQRKRVSVALELLTKPSLLFLDEPTSGLDPGYDKSVMQMLRGLADGGRSVVVVTHNVAQLEMCDRVIILAPGGRMAYFGPPAQALEYFGCVDFPDLFTLLERDTSTDWAARFANSPFYGTYIGRQAAAVAPGWRGGPAPPPRPAPAAPLPAVAQQSPLDQFAILCRRYLRVIAGDRQYSVFMLALPLLLSLFMHAVPGSAGLSVAQGVAQQSQQPRQLLVLLIIGGALMGCAASIREIVKEQAIYRREHTIGLSRSAYLASKLVILTVLTGLQGLALGLLGVLGLPGPDEPVLLPSGRLEVAIAVAAVSVVSMVVGLLISAMIDNADRGMPLLVLVVMAQLILCGGLFPVRGRVPMEQLSWLSPSRWAFSMGASTADINAIAGPGTDDPLWRHTLGAWLTAFGMCVVLAAVMVALLVVALSRLDPHRKARAGKPVAATRPRR
jgi:ABC-type multidrug transport system ATPase subunit/pSer/pThr/pTyr-binding forkhead associated (FHA) protein